MQASDYITPRQLAAAIGVSESSLKRWTDKGLLPSIKTAGGHRRLPVSGVVQFLRTSKLRLAHPHLLNLPAYPANGHQVTPVADSLYQRLLTGNGAAATALVLDRYAAGESIAAICDGLLQPALAALGEAWHAGQIDPHHEHRATQICRSILSELRRLAPEPASGSPVAIGAAPELDPYSLPTAMVELVLLERGWRALDYGTNTPLNSLRLAAAEQGARLIWLSVTSPITAQAARAMLDALAMPVDGRQLAVIVGGQGLPAGATAMPAANIRIGQKLADLPLASMVDGSANLDRAPDVIGL